MSENLFEAFFTANKSSRPLIRHADGSALTYRDLEEQSGRLANALVRLGVRPGDRVAVQVEKSVTALALYLAILRCGAAFLPLNTGYTLAEIGYFIGDAEPSLVVCDPGAAAGVEAMPNCRGRVRTLDAAGEGSMLAEAAGLSPDFATVPRERDDLATILYTSGTTGRSKGAMLTHGNLLSNADVLRRTWRFTPDDVLIHALPIYHAHGLFVAANVTLLTGSSMFFLPRFDADTAIALMPSASVMMGVPTFYVRLLKQAELAEASHNIRLFVSGSAPLLPDTFREWKQATGHAILERYGMTETSMLTSNPYDADRVPGSVGFPLDGVSLRVTDPGTGSPLAKGDVGMIEVSGPNVFKGYWRMPEKTAAEFRDGYFITGDLGRIDERGYVHIVGRGKDMIITGGLNVYPIEVEAEIDALPGIVESAVIGLEHPDFGEGVTAVAVAAAGSAVTEAGIISALQDRLSKFKQPKRVIFIDDLPRNTMGKVQKNVLRDRYRTLYTMDAG